MRSYHRFNRVLGNKQILCNCGCGELINKYDDRGRERKYKRYHTSKSFKNRPEVRKKLSESQKGKIVSIETRKKQSEKRKEFYENGGVHPRLGVKLSIDEINNIRNKRWTIERRKEQSEKMTNMNILHYKNGGDSPMKGKHHSEKTIKKIKNSWTLEMRQKMRDKLYAQDIHKRNTSIERKLQSILSINGIDYKTHEIIELSDDIKHSCDIFIPSKNLIIEADGCYFHGCSNCYNEDTRKHPQIKKKVNYDFISTKLMKSRGYKILRFWEHDINTDLVKCFETIQSI